MYDIFYEKSQGELEEEIGIKFFFLGDIRNEQSHRLVTFDYVFFLSSWSSSSVMALKYSFLTKL